MKDNLCWKTTFGGRRRSVGDDLWWKMFGIRGPSEEDDLRWKTTFDGRLPSVEDTLWKTTVDGRQPSVEDHLQWETTFGGRRPSIKRQLLVEDNIQWKTTFSGRQRSVEDDVWWKTTFGGIQHSVVTPPLDNHSTTEPKPELLSAVSTGNRIIHRRQCMRHCAVHAHVCRKEDIFRQRQLNH